MGKMWEQSCNWWAMVRYKQQNRRIKGIYKQQNRRIKDVDPSKIPGRK